MKERNIKIIEEGTVEGATKSNKGKIAVVAGALVAMAGIGYAIVRKVIKKKAETTSEVESEINE